MKSKFGDWFQKALGDKTLQGAFNEAFRGIGSELLAKAHSPEAVKQLASSLLDHAPAIIGAIVKGTPAEAHVDPAVVAAAEHAAVGDKPA